MSKNNKNHKMTLFLIVSDTIIYYCSIILPVVLYMIFFAHYFTNNNSAELHTTTGKIWLILKCTWLSSVLISATNLIGLLSFGSPLLKDHNNKAYFKKHGWNIRKKLNIVYVSRGDNRNALSRAVLTTLRELERYKVNYRIEIVTDIPVSSKIELYSKIRFYVVPSIYETSKGAKYKARALHYIIEKRDIIEDKTNDTWVLRLDEESIVTGECLAGISKFINNTKYKDSIGQGEIKYNSYKYGNNTLITAIDSVRTGDDLGRFRFQYKFIKKPLFGMHGSYFLVPEHIEERIGFDLGGKGSITEDAYFALHAMEQGVKFNWIEGFIREESPFTIGAILKQRRRWFCGLRLLAFDKSLKIRTRFTLMLNIMLWTIGWMGPIITVINLFHTNGYAPAALTLPAAAIQGSYAAVYLVGAYRGVVAGSTSFWRKAYIYITTLLLLPLSNFIEGLAIFYAITRPVKTFDVVKK